LWHLRTPVASEKSALQLSRGIHTLLKNDYTNRGFYDLITSWLKKLPRRLINKTGLALSVFVSLALLGHDKPPAQSDIKFQVLSVRVLNMEQSRAATRDEIWTTPSVIVRLRLTSTRSGVYFYAFPGDIEPLGYMVKDTASGRLWMYFAEKGSQGSQSSPGIKPLTSGLPGAWLLMSAGTAIEWEVIDNTAFAGERHAHTAFVKRGDAVPIEVTSEYYTVPKPLAARIQERTKNSKQN
jgi:hypothetical protein